MADGIANPLPRRHGNGLPRRRAPLGRRAIKRGFDVTVAFAGLLLLAPLFLVIAHAIRREGIGHILFRQTREGYRRSTFTILKFRTMVESTPSRFEQARRGDPRVTRIGAYLRASSFDELPQMLNVLWGSVSLVGPRPHVQELGARYAALIDDYYERLEVRPGITGLAQISGLRGETTLAQMAARIRLDIAYVRSWSLAGDLAICLRTVIIPLGQDRAY